jgi:type 1 fimbriae regulatory protein FimB
MAIFRVSFHRGLRASEVGLLTIRDLRMKAKRLYVGRLKAGISGEYLLGDDEMRALRGWLRVRGVAPGPLFSSRNGRPISRQRLHELMREYGEVAGLPREKCHWHVLRHSCATSLLSDVEGVDIAEVKDHLGHVDIRSTEVYGKISNRKRRQLGERLAREWKIR